MTNSISAITTGDYFKDPSLELGAQFDYNGDGTVDIADYNLALVYLNDADPENDAKIKESLADANNPVEELGKVFAALIEEDKDNQVGYTEAQAFYDDINDDNVDDVAKNVIAAIKSDANTPNKVNDLKELQFVGQRLTRYIKECAEIAEIYAKQIPIKKKELDDIASKKDEKEAQYAQKKDQVDEKSAKLSDVVIAILQESNRISDKRKQETRDLVANCVNRYARGEITNYSLADAIRIEMGNSGGYDTIGLESELARSRGLGAEINSLCSDIDDLVADIRDFSCEYNRKNAIYRSVVTSRNDIVSAAQLASAKYQTGYQKRVDLREDLIKTYHVKATGGDKYTVANAQVASLGEFLTNGELDKMPFSDAVYIIEHTFDDCGIKVNKDSKGNVSFSVPYGHDNAAHEIYQSFVDSIKANFTQNVSVYGQPEEPEPGYVDPGDPIGVGTISRTDPISFTDGDVKYEFINDKNGDGIFNDSSEFLGASNGWAEMEAYDLDGDGHISGEELDGLKLVGINQGNGQFTFKTASEAGIADIDLKSYKETEGDKMQINGDILDGSFSITMADGSTRTGEQSYDVHRNLENKFSMVYGADIEKTTEEMYDDQNPFMEEFEETIDTKYAISESEHDIDKASSDSDDILDDANAEVKNIVNSQVRVGEKLKADKDAKEAEEAKEADKKAAAKEEAKQIELAQAEEKKALKDQEAKKAVAAEENKKKEDKNA